jgi:beta-glucosidase/6-phospho-beta-glucosidase/beta-galactosidase
VNGSHGLLGSFLIAGFEGSTHRRRDGRRLDLVAATEHDLYAARDYARMRRLGFGAARESLRWHLDEPEPGRFAFDAERSRIEAAARLHITVAWDLCHFGWPDHVDPFAAGFPDRFAAFAEAAASVVVSGSDPPYWFAPMNEISFLSWAGGEVGVMNPFALGRGSDLKLQLVRAAIAAMVAVRAVVPAARFLHPEPLINVATDPERPHERGHAAVAHDAQFEAWDMLSGRLAPELGGGPSFLDVPGANYYPDNQWTLKGGPLAAGDPNRVALHEMLAALHARYGKPLIISETGAEDTARPAWLKSVQRDVEAALERGVPVEGLCLYPILNHPGWDDERHCRNGLWDYPGPRGGRVAYRPMVRILAGLGGFSRGAAEPVSRAGGASLSQ